MRALHGSGSAGAADKGGSLSAGCHPLMWPPILAGRRAVAACFPPAPPRGAAAGACRPPSEVCVAYRPVAMAPDKAMQEHGLPGFGLLAVWEMGEAGPLSTPVTLLLSEGAPVACCYGSGGCSGVVVAVTEDGAVFGWDLAEPSRSGDLVVDLTKVGGAQSKVAVRRASFTSEASVLRDVLNPEAAVAVAAVAQARGGGLARAGVGSGGGSCSIVVLGVWGDVSVWMMRLVGSVEAAVLESDLGVRPGGCWEVATCCWWIRIGAVSSPSKHHHHHYAMPQQQYLLPWERETSDAMA